LNRNEEKIKIKHKVARINITCKYIVISNLEIVRKPRKKMCAALLEQIKKKSCNMEGCGLKE
jgi:hypothetical protein